MIYAFSHYELDTELFALRRDGQPVALRRKAYQLLLYLLENHTRVVSKQALHEYLWAGRCIGDGTLESTVMAVRRALGDTPQTHRFIQTLHGRGYRFVGEVTARHDTPTKAGGWGARSGDRELAVRAEDNPICRHITVLCCDFRDLCGCTRADPEALCGYLPGLLDRCFDVARRFKGFPAQVLADGLWVYYGYPDIQQGAACRAVLSGLAMIHAAARVGSDFRHSNGTAPMVRVGVHTGHTCVADLGASQPLAVGSVPIVAARLLGLATPASAVVISEDTARLLDGRFRCEAFGTVCPDMGTEPIQAYSVRRVVEEFHTD